MKNRPSKKTQSGKGRFNHPLAIASALGLITIALYLGFKPAPAPITDQTGRSVESPADSRPAAAPSDPRPAEAPAVKPVALPVRGDRDGRVTIEEFSDFQCPFCARSVATLKQILKEYPQEVRWIFRHFPVVQSHPNAPLIHMAALAAGEQGRFWEMHDMVFENRDRVAMEDLLGYARRLGLDMKGFEASLRDRQLMGRIEADYNEGIDRMVRATPTFFINGKKVEGAVPYPLFKQEVERALAGVQGALPAP